MPPSVPAFHLFLRASDPLKQGRFLSIIEAAHHTIRKETKMKKEDIFIDDDSWDMNGNGIDDLEEIQMDEDPEQDDDW